MRVYELAKTLHAGSKDLMDFLREQGVDIHNHMSALTPDQVELLKKQFGGKEAAPAEAAPAADESAEASPDAPAEAPADEDAKGESPEGEDEEGEKEDESANQIVVKGPIVVKEFAEMLELKPNQLIADLMKRNVFASINEKIDFKLAQQVAEQFGKELIQEKKKERKPAAPKPKPMEPVRADAPEMLRPRPPVVTFLGHVDHGKTSLLDHIRKARVAQGEAGGITQHIGAYSVAFDDREITFLDTPGHAAFTSMRARGAQLTDVAVLVVAADDGVMPQTREAYQHASAAGVCLLVAVNKCDLPGANTDRVRQQLQELGIQPEDWGGDVGCVNVSAQTGEGIDQLLERILLESEMLELQANPNRPAEGYVIEARLEPGMGPTATVLVRAGTLKLGDAMVCGSSWGRIKALISDTGAKIRQAGPSHAVKCMGLNSVPNAGAKFEIYKNDREARSVAEERQQQERMEDLNEPAAKEEVGALTLEDVFNQGATGAQQKLSLVLKCDVQGSLEAVEQSLKDIKSDKVSLHIALGGVGNITGNDVLLAKASRATIVGFHVAKENGVDKAAKHEGVDIRLYSVIYELIDDVTRAMAGLLEPLYKERTIGKAEIRQMFDIGRTGKIAGCMAIQGRIRSNARARVHRKDEVIYKGKIASLKRFQNDAAEVREGQECGIGLDHFAAFDVGDVIECFEMDRIEQEL